MSPSAMTATDLARLAARSGLSLLYLVGGLVLALLGAVVLTTTAQDILAEDAMQEGVEAFHRRDASAVKLLRDLRSEGQPAASVFLGAYEYENADGDADKLQTAVGLFEEALANEPGRTSAVIGLVSAKLALAEIESLEALKAAGKDMAPILEGASDGNHPDLVYLKAALEVLDGKAAEAVEVLSEDPSEAPSQEGQGARWWNLTLAKLLAHQNPLPAAARAYNLRRWPIPSAEQRRNDPKVALSRRADPERLLKLAYRFALCDPSCTPSDKEALEARVEFGRKMLDQVFLGNRAGGGRYVPPKADAAEIHNALGVGLWRVERYSDATTAFQLAVRGQKRDPLYSMNLAVAATQALPGLRSGPAVEFDKVKEAAAKGYATVCALVSKDPKRQSTLKLAVDNVITLYYDKSPSHGMGFLRQYQATYPSEPDWNRHMGALMDWARKAGCMRHYEKAIELGHPDAAGISERLKLWEAKRAKR